jgi:D-aminopeptidase
VTTAFPSRAHGSLKCSDLGLIVGRLRPGPSDDITDVPGVRVGHNTVDRPESHIHTGCTAIEATLTNGVVPAAAHVINGYGKPAGLAQIRELGTLETPIVLTNTFAVGAAYQAILEHMLDRDPALRQGFRSLNPVVAECNDSALSDMQSLPLTPSAVRVALDAAAEAPVAQGSVGAGRGMTLFDLKGGIGTASRVVAGDRYVVGVLVLTNFGRLPELTVAGLEVGKVLAAEAGGSGGPPVPAPPGSVVAIVATDAPLLARQLERLLRRVQSGLARTGSIVAHGSGEFAIGFSTTPAELISSKALADMAELETSGGIDELFAAVIESTEEAVLNSLFNAESMTGRNGATRRAFPIERLEELLGAAEGLRRGQRAQRSNAASRTEV